MKIQQRRLFFLTATSNANLKEVRPAWKRCFGLNGLIAVTLTALLLGCTSPRCTDHALVQEWDNATLRTMISNEVREALGQTLRIEPSVGY